MANPFPTNTYIAPKYFCDRNQELSTLITAFNNKQFCVLHAIRRVGKTGLIHHLHHHLNKRKKTLTVYVDIMDTQDDGEFVNKLIDACLQALSNKTDNIINKVSKYFSRYSPIFSIDPITASPQIQLNLKNPADIKMSISTLATILGESKLEIQISIDEFQQISNYPKTTIDATLRGLFHKMPNVHFLFSGSQRNFLLGLFSDKKKPMFSSAQPIGISKIEKSIYADFIKKNFEINKKSIDDDVVEEILEWTQQHTYYTQYLCNRLFAQNASINNIKLLYITKSQILRESEVTFYNYKNLLSTNQWKLLKGIARREIITSLSSDFLHESKIAESTARQSLSTLLDKEIIYSEIGATTSYHIYDPFFMRWLQNRS